MDTPIFNLSEEELHDVYEPAEDSFLLIDTLENDLELLKSQKCAMCLEVGIGSGVVITALAMELRKYFTSFYLGIDINAKACQASKKTSIINSVRVEAVQMDLLDGIVDRGIFDVIIFNPPYVATEPLEVLDRRLIFKTWAGGHRGREVMDRLFPKIPHILSDNGFFYLLVIKDNKPHEIIELFKGFNMTGSIVAERKIRGEHLHVLRFQKSQY
ncbi:hemK methyltransferase family member 2 [Copidosoma floridanum]|uniref:hemK methyltransferase family member 2 n=1 Tax=Copidosoma floridanum TaxID=29053 RepID=UPI0006C98C54|nr:hemK methyltransferase family member 2 [Copidosoma floridanum]XP_014214774.1 hemK methyltransferase family member 2 [Copidosoma floridanum]XP_023246114.1 hemK methyltransferase family member 2 [Copidosoma floridanum]